jgi:hypothetical protein
VHRGFLLGGCNALFERVERICSPLRPDTRFSASFHTSQIMGWILKIETSSLVCNAADYPSPCATSDTLRSVGNFSSSL